MMTCGDLDEKVHAKETLRQRAGQTEQCTRTDNIDIYIGSDSSMLHFIVASGIGDILLLFSDIFTLSEREVSHCKAFPKPQQILAILDSCMQQNYVDHVLFLYAISPADDTMFFMGYVCVHVVPIMAFVMIYEICSKHRARGRTRSSSVNHLIGCDELHHCVPSSEAFPTRRRLQELRLRIALHNREVDEFENFTLRELPSVNVFGIPYMNEEEIDALRVHNYKGTGLGREGAPTQASSSSASAKEFWKVGIMDEDRSCDELTCNICLEQVVKGDLVHSLPCLHQFHSRCVDPWHGLNACPICKMDIEISDDEIV